MAGRPRTMARRVARLHDQALDLLRAVIETCPRMYQNHPNGATDRICLAWRKSTDMALEASVALQELGQILREKAGLVLPESLQLPADDEEEDEEAPVRS